MQARLRLIVASAVGVIGLLVLLERFVLVELLVRRTAMPLVVALLTALAAMACGSLARRAGAIDVPLDFVVGLPIFGTLCFLVGLVNVSKWSMAIAGLVAASYGVWQLTVAFRSGADEAQRRTAPLHVTTAGGALAIGVVLLCGFVMAQAPPISLDELAYHLAVPRTWAIEGRAIELPLLSHSYFPLGVESASLPALTLLGGLRGGIASHLLHLLVAMAAVALIVRRTSSWLAAAAIATTPALALTAGWSLVEWPLVALAVALVAALESDDDRTAIAVTAAGFLTKYTFFPLALVAFVVARKWRPALIGGAAGSVFVIRNLLLTGNPFAPFFAAGAPHVSGFRTLSFGDYVFQGQFVDEAIGGSILALASAAAGPIALALLVLAIVLFFLGPSARILLPFLAAAGSTAGSMVQRSRVFRAILAILVLIQLFFVAWFTFESGAFGLMAGRYSEEEFVRSQRATMPAIDWINTSLPPRSKTLVVGIGETYWFTQPVRGGGNFDGERMSRYLTTQTPDALRERLRVDGITHVAVLAPRVPTSEAAKRAERTTALTPAAQRALAQMLDRYAASVSTRGEDALFTLK